jgi:hypothetical protein
MRVVWSDEVSLLVVTLYTHAPRIRLGDLDCFITLSLESHRHLRVSINESIVGESATIPLTCSFLIRFSAT